VPAGADLEKVDQKLKGLKLTIRNAPLQQPESLRLAYLQATRRGRNPDRTGLLRTWAEDLEQYPTA
jgi:hypothetical protein